MKQLRTVIHLLLSAGFFSLGLTACSDNNDTPVKPQSTSVRIAELMNDDTRGGFARVESTREFDFPVDHGRHPEFKHERWHFSGNLESLDGERYGYQFSIHRIGLTPDTSAGSKAKNDASDDYRSTWRTSDIYLANFSITDVEDDKFYQSEKMARSTLGLAKVVILSDTKTGKSALEFSIDDWKVRSTSDDIFPLHIFALHNDAVIDLTVHPVKGIKLNGHYGKSQKGHDDGNASLYYSIPRLNTKGSIAVNGKVVSLEGDSWFDHEWGTSIRGSQVAGIDWYSLQLTDGRDLTFYRLRDINNKTNELSRGIMVQEDGQHENINYNDIYFHASKYWTSPVSNITYPVSWDIRVPKFRLNLHLTPLIDHQEINLAQTYWEGAMRIAGYQKGSSTALNTVNGYGYVRLTGYTGNRDLQPVD